jgi:ABC-2 type transport system permease protein
MSRAWRIASKELLQTRRDRLAALFTLVLPVIFTIFLGLIIGGIADDPRLPVAVVDQDLTPASQQLLDRLAASPVLRLETTAAEDISTEVQDQSVAAGLVIPKGFGAALEESERGPVALPLIRLQTSSGAQSVIEAVQTAVAELNVSLLASRIATDQAATETGMPPDEDLASRARALVEAGLAAPALTIAVTEARPVAANEDEAAVENATGFDISSTGSLVNWVLFSLLTVATGVAWERQRGLLRRLTSTGAGSRVIVGGKMWAMVIITLIQQSLLILLGQFAFGVDYFNSPGGLVLTMISLSALAATTGLLISAIFHSEQAVVTTTVITAQLLAVLGGAWFPLEVTSESFSRIAHFFPSAWIMDALHGIVLKGWGVPEVVASLGIVWVWIVVLFGLAVWRFRPE